MFSISKMNKMWPLSSRTGLPFPSILFSWPTEFLVIKCQILSHITILINGFPGSSDGKESGCNAEDRGLIPGWRRSPGGGKSNPLQYSCLGNPTDREEPGRQESLGSQRVGHSWADNTSIFYFNYKITQSSENQLK